MRVFLTGVGCVGKTTIGARLANLNFFDLDTEIEQFFEMSIERLQQKHWMPHDFRREASKALTHILDKPESQRSVIALPPSGLMGGYLSAIKKTHGFEIALMVRPENILDRIVFYDVESRPMDRLFRMRNARCTCGRSSGTPAISIRHTPDQTSR